MSRFMVQRHQIELLAWKNEHMASLKDYAVKEPEHSLCNTPLTHYKNCCRSKT